MSEELSSEICDRHSVNASVGKAGDGQASSQLPNHQQRMNVKALLGSL